MIRASRAAKRSHEGGKLSVETGVASEGESRRKRRSAVESTEWVRRVSLLSPNFAKFETVRGCPWRLALPRLDPPPFSCDPDSCPLFLSPSLPSLFRSSARLSLSFSLSISLSCRPPTLPTFQHTLASAVAVLWKF